MGWEGAWGRESVDNVSEVLQMLPYRNRMLSSLVNLTYSTDIVTFAAVIVCADKFPKSDSIRFFTKF